MVIVLIPVSPPRYKLSAIKVGNFKVAGLITVQTRHMLPKHDPTVEDGIRTMALAWACQHRLSAIS